MRTQVTLPGVIAGSSFGSWSVGDHWLTPWKSALLSNTTTSPGRYLSSYSIALSLKLRARSLHLDAQLREDEQCSFTLNPPTVDHDRHFVIGVRVH